MLHAVPLYDSLGESSVEYIIDHAEASTVFTSTQKFPLLEKTLPKTKKHIKTIIYFGEVTEDSKRVAAAAEQEVGHAHKLGALLLDVCNLIWRVSQPLQDSSLTQRHATSCI